MATVGRPRSFTEDAVVTAARDFFWDRGYDASPVGDLVTALGLSRASLYTVFGDKEGLFVRAVGRYVEDGAAVLRELGSDGGPVLPALRAYLRAGLTAPRTDGATTPRGCLLGTAAAECGGTSSRAAEAVRQGLAESESGVAAALGRARDNGEIDASVDVPLAARSLFAIFEGLAAMARAGRDLDQLLPVLDQAVAGLAPAG